jgi:hypothetical protein
MPRSKNARKHAARPAERTAPKKESRTESTKATSPASFEDGFQLFRKFSEELGDTVTAYLRRYGEEQQKNFEQWNDTVRAAAQPAPDILRETEEARARFQEWNHRSEEIGQRVRDAFLASLGPNRAIFETWAQPYLPLQANPEAKAKEFNELVQRFWGGLGSDLTRTFWETLQPGKSVDEFTRAQEASLKDLTENFNKLFRIYFTSPAFVTMFGKTLDSSLEFQKTLGQGVPEDFPQVLGFPNRKEIENLQQAVDELTQKVGRLSRSG